MHDDLTKASEELQAAFVTLERESSKRRASKTAEANRAASYHGVLRAQQAIKVWNRAVASAFIALGRDPGPHLRAPPFERSPFVGIDRGQLKRRSQPRELPLGELAGREDAATHCLVQREFPVKIGPKLPIAHCANRRMIGGEITARAKRGHLVEKTKLHHFVESLFEALVQSDAICRHQGPIL